MLCEVHIRHTLHCARVLVFRLYYCSLCCVYARAIAGVAHCNCLLLSVTQAQCRAIGSTLVLLLLFRAFAFSAAAKAATAAVSAGCGVSSVA
jgi:hypothetical protein